MIDVATVYKYPLEVTYRQEIELPCIHSILDIQVQAGTICMWVAVSPSSPKEAVIFYIVGTGQELPSGTLTYIKTVQLKSLVWHIFKESK